MSRQRIKEWLAAVTLWVEGEQIEAFLDACRKSFLFLRDVKYISKNKVRARCYFQDMKKVRELANRYQLRLTLDDENGLFVSLRVKLQETYKLVALLLSGLFLFFLSHTVWQVNLQPLSYQLEKDIQRELNRLNIYPGAFQVRAPSVEAIEKALMENIPELLYISVKKRGTIYTIEALEKIDKELESSEKPSHLIAEKSGVIKKMLVEQGQPVINVNDFVQKGDLLVSGELLLQEEADDQKKDKKKEASYVRSIGEVYANTWYEVTVSLPQEHQSYHLDGDHVHHYAIDLVGLRIPIKFWPKLSNEYFTTIIERYPLKVFNYELPIVFYKEKHFPQTKRQYQRSVKEAKALAIDHALENLQGKLGKETEIEKYYILHEAVDNGKVKLRLYVSAVENIAREKPIKKEKVRD